jgi:hypothetical protein
MFPQTQPAAGPGDRPSPSPTDDFELRLFLEEICCNLCRFRHVSDDGIAPERVRIDQEVYLGVEGAFADIRVQAPGVAPYFVEVKFAYAPDRVVRTLARKYGPGSAAQADAARVVLVYDTRPRARLARRRGPRPRGAAAGADAGGVGRGAACCS